MQPRKSTAKPSKSKDQDLDTNPLPGQVVDLLKTNSIGYLSVMAKSGELYSYPIAYYFSKEQIYFVTPVSAAKYKIIKNNPMVSFITDNGKVTTEACGAMLQGRAKIFTVGRTVLSILSVGPKIAGFSRKYPGMLSFYARGKELPDERKLYKYRLIRISPTKIVYWIGYTFGRRLSRNMGQSQDSLDLPEGETGLGIASRLLQPVEKLLSDQTNHMEHDWLTSLQTSTVEGVLSEEERKVLDNYKLGKQAAVKIARPGSPMEEERRMLRKLKEEKER